MKRFLVFGWDECDSSGGMNDFINDFEILKEAREFIGSLHYSWYQIYDSEKDYMVYETEVTF